MEGVICGLSAMYTGLGQIMNEVYNGQLGLGDEND
jgi:succinate-acetate transporter protein